MFLNTVLLNDIKPEYFDNKYDIIFEYAGKIESIFESDEKLLSDVRMSTDDMLDVDNKARQWLIEVDPYIRNTKIKIIDKNRIEKIFQFISIGVYFVAVLAIMGDVSILLTNIIMTLSLLFLILKKYYNYKKKKDVNILQSYKARLLKIMLYIKDPKLKIDVHNIIIEIDEFINLNEGRDKL